MEFPFLLEQFRNEYHEMVQARNGNVNTSSVIIHQGDVTILETESSSDGSELEDEYPC